MRISRILFVVALVVAVGVVGRYLYRRYATPPAPEWPSTSESTGDRAAAVKFHRSLSTSEREHILDGDYRIVSSTASLPASIKQAFATVTGQKQFLLADPGAKYQVTDVVDEPGLPFRRLVFAGVSGDQWFIHYEHGGIGHSYSILVFRIQPGGRAAFVWGGAGDRANDLGDLRHAIASGRFTDDCCYYWSEIAIALIEGQ
jgi:hypothetical protein